MKTIGSATVSSEAYFVYCSVVIFTIWSSEPIANVAMKLANIARPQSRRNRWRCLLVSAFVVLPTASRSARIWRARLYSSGGMLAGLAGL